MEMRAQTGPTAEIKIIPSWAWALGAIGFLCAQYYFNFVLAKQPDAPPAWARAGLGILAGTVLGCYLLFIGYINRDASRRRMSSVLWTLVAIVIPNGLGLILYFILRQPLPGILSGVAHRSSTEVSSCPRCGYQLSASCPKCQRVVAADDSYCRSCGNLLHAHASAAL